MSAFVNRMPRLWVVLALAFAALILTPSFDAPLDRDAGIDRGMIARDAMPAEAATGAPWCGPVNGLDVSSCRYLTFERCLEAAGADYRSCKPNPAAIAVPNETPYWTYRSIFL